MPAWSGSGESLLPGLPITYHMSHISSYKDTNHIHEGLKGPTSKYHQAEKKYECGGDTNIQCTANNTLLLTDIKIILPRHLDTSIYEIQ